MLTLIGLGAGDADTLSRGAERALREASRRHVEGSGRLFLRTARHPVVDFLRAEGLHFETFDALYDAATDFDTLYAEIAARILEAARQTGAEGQPLPVAYAVPGHPLFGEDTVRRIREGAEAWGQPVTMLSSGSFVEAALTAVGASLGAGCDVRHSLSLSMTDTVSQSGERVGGRIDVSRGLLLYQVFDPESASHAKLA